MVTLLARLTWEIRKEGIITSAIHILSKISTKSPIRDEMAHVAREPHDMLDYHHRSYGKGVVLKVQCCECHLELLVPRWST